MPAGKLKQGTARCSGIAPFFYALGLITLLGVCGAGGAFFFLKNKKQQAAADDHPDPDEDYREDDDGYDIPEETEGEEEYDESEDE